MKFLPFITFAAFFLGIIALVIVVSIRQGKMWRERPNVLRQFAARRGFSFVDKPGSPEELTSVRPFKVKEKIKRMEVPAAVRGRTLDDPFTLFDVYVQSESGHTSNRTLSSVYETMISFKTARTWPQFEFIALAQLGANTITAKILQTVVKLADGMMAQRGLHRVEIPEEPGFQLYVSDPGTGVKTRDGLMRVFKGKSGWWVGAKNDTLTLMRSAKESSQTSSFITADGLDAFVNEAIEIERGIRGIATTPQ